MALIGGASVITVILGVIRTKAIALFVGAPGIGLIGAYNSITSLVGTVAGMGINSSGVRQIAEAVGTGDEQQVARTIKAVRRLSLCLGVLGTLAMLAMAGWFSWWTFENTAYTRALGVLSLTILFMSILGGQSAIMQGMRRIGDLARLSILGAALGTLATIPLVWIWGVRGIVPSLVAATGLAVITAWWYIRRVKVPEVSLPWSQTLAQCGPLLRFGMALMLTGLMTTGVGYISRAIIVRKLGLDAAGHYQAAWALSSMYVGYVLSAMGTDFYPRLTAINKDHAAMARMVNEQVDLSLLLAAPGLLATLALAPLVIVAFYSTGFGPAAEVLQWQVLGILFRVVSWPLGFIILAKGSARVFTLTELSSNIVHLAGIWLGVRWFGLQGAGIAFFVLYLFCWVLVYGVARRMIGFRYSATALSILGIVTGATAAAFLLRQFLPSIWGSLAAGGITLAMSVYCANTLARLAPTTRPARWWMKCRSLLLPRQP